MAALHFICGKAGSAKTTLARELGRILPAIVFCEDEWISALGFGIRSLDDDFLTASARCRKLIEPLAIDLLRMGVSVVSDFGGNTVKSRQGIRSIFEAAGADHLLYVIEASDAECLANIHRRNAEKPPGVYWGDVNDEIFHAVRRISLRPRLKRGSVSSDAPPRPERLAGQQVLARNRARGYRRMALRAL
jgi:predicted kinase